ncbi:exodeoxyribonuclease VII small subunit [Effusibacillus pohliae]|uniref:exodeoxyribonuclease VII small subunit n=1 Tax=Effusibacillus pohliae TaxID=232270 RepID=UPI0003746068|nr:exodeoxyribonuclease VII small subunit [Effusibacillus pohliae]
MTDKKIETNEQQAHKTLSFEEALAGLEKIVRELEAGEIPLEQAIASFQEGMQLAKICREKLDQAEQKIEMLVADAAGLSKKPFAPEE